jgi:large subunit ribosomal protein L6
MSRIGNRELTIPAGVTVTLDGHKLTVKGPKGELSKDFNELIDIKVEDGKITCKRPNDNLFTKAIHGTTNALINNMLIGVSEGFTKELEAVGVGYKFALSGNRINISAGYSHPVIYRNP